MVVACWFGYFYFLHTVTQCKVSKCQLGLFRFGRKCGNGSNVGGWLMHLVHWSMQTQTCSKYLMQTISASHYPEKLSTAWGSCQCFFFSSSSSPFFHIHPFPHTDKSKNIRLTDTQTSIHYDDCHTRAGSSSKNYCNYLPSGVRSYSEKADQDLQEVSSVWKAQAGLAELGTSYIVFTPLLILRQPLGGSGLPLSTGPVFDLQCTVASPLKQN